MTEQERATIEQEANVFATLLLVPQDLLLKELEKGLDLAGPIRKKESKCHTVESLAKLFQVPVTVMAFRLSLLKYAKD